MRVEVQSLTGEALVVPVTTKAKLSFERTHKKAIDEELRSGMVGPLYEIVHTSLRQIHPETIEDFDEWLEVVETVTILPEDLTTHLMRILRKVPPDVVDGVADIIHSYAEATRSGMAEAEVETAVPTGGEPTATPDDSPSPPSGQDSTPTD